MEFCFVCGVFVEAEEVDVGEITFDCWREVVLVDLVEDNVEVGGDRWDVGIDDVDEDVNGVCVDSCPFVVVGMPYRCADVAREGISLVRWWWGRVALVWDRVCV
jgi:hypothetical protein